MFDIFHRLETKAQFDLLIGVVCYQETDSAQQNQ